MKRVENEGKLKKKGLTVIRTYACFKTCEKGTTTYISKYCGSCFVVKIRIISTKCAK